MRGFYSKVDYRDSVIFFRVLCVFLDDSKHDKEGRVITAEFDKFYVVTACKFFALSFSVCVSSIEHWTEHKFRVGSTHQKSHGSG